MVSVFADWYGLCEFAAGVDDAALDGYLRLLQCCVDFRVVGVYSFSLTVRREGCQLSVRNDRFSSILAKNSNWIRNDLSEWRFVTYKNEFG